MTPRETVAAWQAGLITQEEAQHALEAANVYGGFDKGYTGYDYTKQEWITTNEDGVTIE